MSENTKHHLMLFVSGMSPKSSLAIENIHHICDKYLQHNYELQIVDINRERQMAVTYQIIGIPTLIKLFPAPRRIILGDLSDIEKVLNILDIEPKI